MADMVTALTGYSNVGTTITYETAGHSLSDAKLVVQKRGQQGSGQTLFKGEVAVVAGAEDSAGDQMPNNLRLTAASSIPVGVIAADIDAAIVIFRDYVASDDFPAAVKAGTKIADF